MREGMLSKIHFIVRPQIRHIVVMRSGREVGRRVVVCECGMGGFDGRLRCLQVLSACGAGVL